MSARDEAEARLRRAEWLHSDATQRIFAVLDPTRTRAVGGLVRDTILGRAPGGSELDVATELLPEEVTHRATEAGIAVHPTGIAHGTVTLVLGDTVAEVTTLREDVETDGRRAKVKFGTDWSTDAGRRDFTLNALYTDADGTLFDPLGGLADCLSHRVRFIGDADRRIAEDKLRVYRFFRFSASHAAQRLDGDGLAACRRAAGHLGRLSAERIGSEMKRLLAQPKVALTVQAMVLSDILPLSAQCQKLLTVYEQRAANPTLQARLAIIMRETDVRKSWRLSNAEASSAEAVLDARSLLVAGKANEAAYRYPDAVSDALALVAQPIAVPDRVPRFPLSGRDLVRHGYAQGPALGRELQRLEQAWIDSGFTIDRATLLAAVRTD